MCILAFEQVLGVLGKFEKLDALVHVRLLGILVPFDVVQAAILFLAPFSGHLVEKDRVHPSVELINIHRLDPLTETLVLRLKPFDRFLMFVPLVGMAGIERVTDAMQSDFRLR